MTILETPAISPTFTMSQEEVDAVALLTRRPYHDGQDTDLLSRVMSFMARYVSMKGEPEPSRGACELLEQCFIIGDYRKLDGRMSEYRTRIHKMFARASR